MLTATSPIVLFRVRVLCTKELQRTKNKVLGRNRRDRDDFDPILFEMHLWKAMFALEQYLDSGRLL